MDLIFTDTPGVVAGNVGSPIGTSDHCYISAIIKTEHAVLDISFSRKIYLKSQADWDGISNDLRELDWPHIYTQVDFVASMNDVFEGIIVRRIPSRVIKFHIKDKAWFNENCKRANLAKQEAYQLWRRDCSDITWNMLFSYKNKYHYTYPNTYIALYFSYAKVTCNTHKNKKLLSIPLKFVPSLAKLPLPYFPPSTRRSASSHPN